MDVLELPRPVINFLRTMAKESCRYALSWDIFGGPDSVTLTLTWKLIDDESASSMINETSLSVLKQPAISTYDDCQNRSRSTAKTQASPSSPRRSRRDEPMQSNDNASIPAIFRSSRGKSLEGGSSQVTKSLSSHHSHYQPQQQQQQQQQQPHNHNYQQQQQQQQHYTREYQPISSLERTSVTNNYQQRQKKPTQPPITTQKTISTPSDQIYGHIYDTRSSSVVKCATVSSLSSSSPSPQPTTNNPSVPIAHTNYQRGKQQQQTITSPTAQKLVRPSANLTSSNNSSSVYAKLQRTNHIARLDDDDDDDSLDPWVKRFECSLEDNDNDDTTEQSEERDGSTAAALPADTSDESGLTSGKVKFKTKPDYF
jgi:DNA polymerase III alpha subunit (gram-positive type)